MAEPPLAAADASSRDQLAKVSAKLLRSAEGTVRDAPPLRKGHTPLPELSEFVQVYREWITLERGELGTQQQQADQWQMLVHCMVNAATIHDAIRQLLHFAPVVWGERAPTGLLVEGDFAALVFNEPYRPGPEGLVAAIWMLSLILSTLEFLGNTQLQGASGRVIHDAFLPDGVDRLLFNAPLAYGQADVALLLPRQQLRRPVAVRAADLPKFFRQLLPLTLGAVRSIPDMRAMVAGLIRDYKQNPPYREVSRGHVAAVLGVSEATMRRRLDKEGVTFRQVRDEVYSALALDWLERGDVAIGSIAARLGFSDAFAFRRFFTRQHNLPPSAFRHRQRANESGGEG